MFELAAAFFGGPILLTSAPTIKNLAEIDVRPSHSSYGVLSEQKS